MAQKRMFDKSIIENDYFMDLPIGSKALYFLLGMEADDEGFVSPKRVLKLYGGSEDDIRVLIAKNFLIQFPSGVVVITDWKENNWLDTRRIKETQFMLEKSMLETQNKKYVLPLAKRPLSIGEVRIEENRIEENRIEEIEDQKISNKYFVKPTVDEVRDYCLERKNGIDAEKWIDYYISNGWKVGKSAMKDWKATVRNWERNNVPKKTEILPVWFDKDIDVKKVSKEEQDELNAVLSKY